MRLTGIVGDRRQGVNVYYNLIRSDNKAHRELLLAITRGLADLETFKKDAEALNKLRLREDQMRPREVRCPECEQKFELEAGIQIGDITYCFDCEAELKVVKLNPPKVETIKTVFDEFEEKDKSYYPEHN